MRLCLARVLFASSTAGLVALLQSTARLRPYTYSDRRDSGGTPCLSAHPCHSFTCWPDRPMRPSLIVIASAGVRPAVYNLDHPLVGPVLLFAHATTTRSGPRPDLFGGVILLPISVRIPSTTIPLTLVPPGLRTTFALLHVRHTYFNRRRWSRWSFSSCHLYLRHRPLRALWSTIVTINSLRLWRRITKSSRRYRHLQMRSLYRLDRRGPRVSPLPPGTGSSHPAKKGWSSCHL